MKRIAYSTAEGHAFGEWISSSIAAMPGATFEERVAALAAQPEWAWLNEPLPLTPTAHRLIKQAEAADVFRASAHSQAGRERAKQVKALRKQLGLIQADAAAKMGIARTSVVAIEKGVRGVSVDELAKLIGSTTGGAS